MLLTNMDLENGKMNPVSKGLKTSSPKCSSFFACVIADLSWQFHENPFIHFTIMLLTDTPLHLGGRLWNSLGNFFLCHAWPFMKISWKSIYPLLHNITKNRGPQDQSWIQKVKHSISKMFQVVPCLMSHFGWKFHENPLISFPVMMLTDMNFLENRKRKPVSKGFNIATPKFFRLFLVSCLIYPENFMKIHLSVFPQGCWQTNKQTNKSTNRNENITLDVWRR